MVNNKRFTSGNTKKSQVKQPEYKIGNVKSDWSIC